MIGFLPPSSSCTRRPSPIAAWILRPVAVDPVNVMAFDAIVGHQVRAGVESVHDVEHALGQAGVDERGGQPVAHQRRHRRRLEDDGVPGCQRRADLPTGEIERKVPRRDDADDADGIEDRVDERRVVARERGARQAVRLSCVQLEVARRARRLHRARRRSACPPRRPSRRRCRRPARRGCRAAAVRISARRVGVVRRHDAGGVARGIDRSRDVGDRRLRRDRHDLTSVGRVARARTSRRSWRGAVPRRSGC